MTLDELIAEYEEYTPTSRQMYERSSKVLPGGVTANVKYYAPYPIFMKGGEGAWLVDVDGHRYVDYLASYGPLILGHKHPAVINALKEQFEENGAHLYGTPHELEYLFAEKIMEHFPSIEMLRYTNSGTEATLLAIRMAYAHTGKYKIGKFEGHYHGGYNEVLVSVNPDVKEAGDIHHPTPLPESKGLEPYRLEDTVILPYNDLEGCREILTAHKDDMAAVIMEPIQTGFIMADKEFMVGLRELTKELGILLIYDEVKTGFRAGLGGAQGVYGIKPDLTTMGKAIGAGFPMGIVGGRKDILMDASPLGGADILDMSASHGHSAADVLYHSGTYNGHPMILKAGLATIEVLEKEFDHIVAQTSRLRKGIEEAYADKGIKVLTIGEATVFNYAITDLDEIKNYRDMQTVDYATRKKVDYALFKEGVYNKPLNRFSVSAVHDDAVIDYTIQAFRNALNKI